MLGQTNRRAFMAALIGLLACSLSARGQQPRVPVVGFLNARLLEGAERFVAAYKSGLGESGYIEAQNVAIEYRWAEGARADEVIE
jgi:putative tryptophan/tyrosine transport system substrate-binding protein